MKTIDLRKAVSAAAVLFAVGQSSGVGAHEQAGSLGKSAGATDLYQVSCSGDSGGDSDRLNIQVLDSAPAASPLVSVQVQKGTSAANSTDPKDGDTAYSPMVSVKGGNGAYTVMVNKTASGAENYTLEFHCQAKDGNHTGTAIVPLQNQ